MKWNEMNEIGFEVQEAERLVGLKVHQHGFKPANLVEWWSEVASET